MGRGAQAAQVFGYAEAGTGMAHGGGNVGQGHQDEGALEHGRVGHNQARSLDALVAI